SRKFGRRVSGARSPFDGLLTGRSGNEDILPLEPALLHHLHAVLDSSQVFVAVVRAKREFHSRLLRRSDESRFGQTITVVDLDGHVILLRGLDDLLYAFR